MNILQKKLAEFTSKLEIEGKKGPLCLMLVITRKVRQSQPPFSPDEFLVPKRGQVAGLGKTAVQAILADYGITRTLAEEGGRTSRGSINRMQSYVEFLNELVKDGLFDLSAIENWWVDCVRNYFTSLPIKLKVDASKSMRSIVSDLVEAAYARQSESSGTMVAGAVIQHLVGAKLELAMPGVKLTHSGFSVADAPGKRKGDFRIGDTVIHVTMAPTEALIRKCCSNIDENLRPVIITTEKGSGGAIAFAKNADVSNRIDIFEIEQFVAMYVLEYSGFSLGQRPVTIRELIACYNRIVEQCETDPNLKIEIG